MEEWIYERLESWLETDSYREALKIEKEKSGVLNNFLKKFTVDRIKTMSLEDYSDGRGNDESFCNYVERTFQVYGKISGRTNAYQKYVIFWDKKQNKYVFGDKRTKQRNGFGSSAEEIFDNVKRRIAEIVMASENGDYATIAESPLNPQFKNKIAYLFNPEQQMPIYSDNDLNTICNIFNIPFSRNDDRAYKRKALFEYYKKSRVSKGISPFIFMRFIYDWGGFRSSLRDADGKPVQASEYTMVDVTVKEVKSINRSREVASKSTVYDPSSEEKKRLTGKKGEEIVEEYLNAHKLDMDIASIKTLCSGPDQNDSAGYDFEYTTNDGEIFYIEVKTTRRDLKDDVFFEMSANEYEVMKRHPNNYHVYFVNNVNNGKVIKRISGGDITNPQPSKYTIYFSSIGK